MRRLALLTASITATACATAPATLRVDPSVRSAIAVDYYDVSGATAQEVRAALSEKGPKGYDARTDWYVKWHYPHLRSADGCRAGEPDVDLQIHYLMPRLDEQRASSPTRQRWHRYFDRLQLHEDGHADNGRAAAAAVAEALRAVPPQPDCDELDRKASAAGHAAIQRFNDADKKYDADTRHGSTQGAIFP